MSKLIEFTMSLGGPRVDPDARTATIRAATKAFGIPLGAASTLVVTQTRVRCTPEQFGLFIAYRVECGMKNNRISCLDTKIVDDHPEIVDLSK